ncbi:MAG: PAS domain-containing protein [Hyphomonadaceae bacterium]|nr:PAS domain-containing protein [Hyphomonadaceae bacterium]
MMGEETFHPDTRALLQYGRALAGGPSPPHAGGADAVVERLFVLEHIPAKEGWGRLSIRSFGQELIALFGRDLKETDFADLWLKGDLALLNAFLAACAGAGEPGILRVAAEAETGDRLGAEVLLTPLAPIPSQAERYLGLFQPLGGEAFWGGRSIARLRLGSLHPPKAKLPRPVRLVVSNA